MSKDAVKLCDFVYIFNVSQGMTLCATSHTFTCVCQGFVN